MRNSQSPCSFKPERVLLFISTHSHPTSGELWVTEPGVVAMGEVRGRLTTRCLFWSQCFKFFKYVFTDKLLTLLRNVESHWFWMTCGSFVRTAESKIELAKLSRQWVVLRFYLCLWSLILVDRYNCTNVIAFGAERLIPSEPTSFIVEYVQAVIIQGFPTATVFSRILGVAQHLGHHTSIVNITPDAILEYIWSSPRKTPNGHVVPLQCPNCGRIKSMEGRTVGKMMKGALAMEVFRCRLCDHTLSFPPKEGFTPFQTIAQRETWLQSKMVIPSTWCDVSLGI